MLRIGYMHYFPICFCLLFLTLIGLVAVNGDLKKEFYIVFLKDRPLEEESLFQSHIDVLSTLKGSDADAKESHVYSYTKIFNAFAAKLSGDEAKKLSGMDEVRAVFKNQYQKLLTTRSWDFLDFPQTVRRNLKMERDIIIGVLDTGISPNSESFKDDGLGPPPVKWKGSCGPFVNFSGCNNKLIGAKYFKADQELLPGEILSPVDVHGHGTHVSSTAAGSVVANASVYGLGRGTARGAVPSARLAMYKVCWAGEGCADMDVLAGVEAAISDGVDILSLSIGSPPTEDFLDVIGVASFLAMRAGVITVASAGNDGPTPGTVGNHAPWILTVAATGMDRQFRSKVVLGNGKTTSGRGVNAFNPERKMYPLVFGADAAITSSRKLYASYCVEDSIDPVKVKGKLVLCNLLLELPDSYIKSIGGIGTINNISGGILYNDGDQIYMAPGTTVNSTEAEPISDYYLHSVRSPSAVIYKSQEFKIPAPFMYIYSSRGPSPGSEYILKPDIAAPGVGILAAYTPLATLTGRNGDTQYSKFTFKTGTSMACPHVSGIAAYVKSFHPDWPPAVIKSAIMTTATPLSLDSDAEFGYGAGQMNPTKAVNPGLVYNIGNEDDYIPFLCREGYSGSILALLFSYNVNCSNYPPPTSHDALNYPTMQLYLKNTTQLPTTVVFQRTVTNVGPSPSIYNATIIAPKGVEITVNPMSLSFSTAFQERNFKVVVKAQPMSKGLKIISASLSWRNSRHVVRSPIVIYQ
ncbi:subtilisin-like protease SBT4.14 [Cornus florida]|uniref:subtilisin-like protease SBT4.14 n=1 Tax=Cornus florida TaxID=4283 RepID=UPI00289A2909|nr:subtilisin-like protease SBT4.14 [Cornus florida]XP_059634071.1 subtilisin-like protease SBT4.14 [Cornus florida]